MYLTSTAVQPLQPQGDLDNAYFKRLLKLTPEFLLSDPRCDQRPAAESYVKEKFLDTYGADIHDFLQYLISMRCLGSLSGVVGLSFASQQALFLEQYLESPIENELGNVSHAQVRRNSVVEVGNLVATTRGASFALFIVVATALSRAGFEHMVFTATRQLRSTFDKLGFKTVFLSDANLGSVNTGSDNSWGSYYDSEPQVVTGSLKDALEVIANRNLFNCLQIVFGDEIDALVRQLRVKTPGA